MFSGSGSLLCVGKQHPSGPLARRPLGDAQRSWLRIRRSNTSIFLRSIDHPSIATQYTDHKAETTVARFSPSGYYVASGDAAGTVRVWDSVGEGVTKGEYFIVQGRINDLAWDGDSQRIVAVGSGKQRFGHCISADSGNTVGEITGHSQTINSVSIRQQRPLRAATAGDDKTLVFYHGAPFKYNNGFRDNHVNYIYGTAFNPDGSMLATVGADRRIWLYDGKTGEPKNEIGRGEHNGSIFALSWSSDSRKFVTASADRTVRVWDAEYGKPIQTWKFASNDLASIPHQQVGVVWPCGRTDGLIISLSLSGDLNYLAEGAPEPVRLIQGHQSNITSLALSVSKGKETIWAGGSDGRICQWDLTEASAKRVEGHGHASYVTSITVDEDLDRLYSVGWDDTVRSASLHGNSYTGGAVKLSSQPRGIAQGASATLVANSGGVEILRDGRNIEYFHAAFPVTTVAAHGSLVAIGGEDSTVQLCALKTSGLEVTYTVKPSRNPITALAFSANGSALAVGDSKGRVVALDVASSKVIVDRWTSHTARVTSLAWDRGDQLASGSLDSNIYIWSLTHPGDRRQLPHAHKGGVNSVAWVPNGSQVISAGADFAVKFWHVDQF